MGDDNNAYSYHIMQDDESSPFNSEDEPQTVTNNTYGVQTSNGAAGERASLHEDNGLHISNQGDVHHIPDEPEGKWLHWPTLAAYVGPGFLVCIAYLDPGNLEADLQTGAYTGYQLIWVLLLAHILGLVLQSLAARLGVVTGTHLADVCRSHYSRPAALLLWVMMEIAIIGSDIQEVLGSAIGLQILFGIPLWVGCLLTALDTFTFLFIHVLGVRKLEALFVALVSVMTVAFFVDFGLSPPSASDVAEGFSFRAKPYATVPALGLIGAVIMPHNLYLHSALVLSRLVDRSSPRKLWEATKYYTIDSGIALLVAFLINLAVVCTFAKQFYDNSCATASIASACFVGDSIDPSQPNYGICGVDGSGLCQEIGLSAAAAALKGTLGQSAKYVWAVGLLAAGQSSTMTGTYAGQFVMEGFLQLQIPKWQRVLLTRVIALGPALAVTVFMGGDIRATDRMSAWLNVLQSLQLPFAIIPLLTFCNSQRIMGAFTISVSLTVFVWMVSVGVIGINLFIVGGFLVEEGDGKSGGDWLYAGAALGGFLYLGFILFLMWDDLCKLRSQGCEMFMKLGGYDVVGGCASSVADSFGQDDSLNGCSGVERAGGFHDDKRPLAPRLGAGSSANVGGAYAPVSGGANDSREESSRENGARRGEDGRGSLARAEDAHRNGEGQGESRV